MSQFTPNYMGRDPNDSPPPTGLAMGSMCCGIGALVVVCVPCLGMLSIPSAIVGIVLGAIVIAKTRRGEVGGKGMAIAGIICGGVALLVYVALAGFWLFAMSTARTSRVVPFSTPSAPRTVPLPAPRPMPQPTPQ